MKAHTLIPLAAVASLFLIAAPRAGADTITFGLNYAFSSSPPAGTAPWLTATFKDVGANTVELTMSASGLSGVEFVSEWYFNLDPTLNPASLTVTAVDVADVASWTLSKGANAFMADGDGKYDLLFDLPTSGDRFAAGDAIVFNLSMTGLSAASFDYLSFPAGGHGPFLTAAHVQGIGTGGTLSGWIAPVPEPSTVIGGLMLLLPIGVGVYRSMRRRA